MAYGFPNAPTENGLEPGFKIGIHLGGIELDPDERDSLDRTPDPKMLEEIRSIARERFGVRDPEILESVGCLYTNLPDDEFAIWREDARTVMMSPCSGHGFKFAPWIGCQVAQEVLAPGSLKKWVEKFVLLPSVGYVFLVHTYWLIAWSIERALGRFRDEDATPSELD